MSKIAEHVPVRSLLRPDDEVREALRAPVPAERCIFHLGDRIRLEKEEWMVITQGNYYNAAAIPLTKA
jgi:hypothetical protein